MSTELNQNSMNRYALKPEGRARLAQERDAARARNVDCLALIDNAKARISENENLIAMIEIALAQPVIQA